MATVKYLWQHAGPGRTERFLSKLAFHPLLYRMIRSSLKVDDDELLFVLISSQRFGPVVQI